MPSAPGAWTLTVAGGLFLLLSLWLQVPMWVVVLGQRSVAPGGGEYMVALFAGLPALLCATALLGLTAIRRVWRSWLSLGALVISLLALAGWVVLVVSDVGR